MLKGFLKDIYPNAYIRRLNEDKNIEATEYLYEEDIELIKNYMIESEGE